MTDTYSRALQEAYKKARSGTRVEEAQKGSERVFVIVRGSYTSQEKYFTFYADGNPCWTTRARCATSFASQEKAEEELTNIRWAEKAIREYRKNPVSK